jgi:hypothetical protein
MTDPERQVNWLPDRLVEFREDHADIPKFKRHTLRRTVLSRPKEAGTSYREAAIAFGCATPRP